MIEIHDNWTYVGIWYESGMDGDRGMNWLACMYRESNQPDDKPWKAFYRFRYYDGDQDKSPHEDGDTKNWYSWTATNATEETRTRMKAGLDMAAKMTANNFGGVVDYLPIDGPFKGKPFLDYLAKPWVHVKRQKVGGAGG